MTLHDIVFNDIGNYSLVFKSFYRKLSTTAKTNQTKLAWFLSSFPKPLEDGCCLFVFLMICIWIIYITAIIAIVYELSSLEQTYIQVYIAAIVLYFNGTEE